MARASGRDVAGWAREIVWRLRSTSEPRLCDVALLAPLDCRSLQTRPGPMQQRAPRRPSCLRRLRAGAVSV